MRLFVVSVKVQSGLNAENKRIMVGAYSPYEAIERAYSQGLIDHQPARIVQPDRSKYTIEKKRKQRDRMLSC
jgi:hypothetical protein